MTLSAKARPNWWLWVWRASGVTNVIIKRTPPVVIHSDQTHNIQIYTYIHTFISIYTHIFVHYILFPWSLNAPRTHTARIHSDQTHAYMCIYIRSFITPYPHVYVDYILLPWSSNAPRTQPYAYIYLHTHICTLYIAPLIIKRIGACTPYKGDYTRYIYMNTHANSCIYVRMY